MSLWTDAQKTVPGFMAAGIFNKEGMIVDGHSADESFHLEHAAAAFVTMLGEADTAGSLISLGSAKEVQLTYPSAVILLRAIPGTTSGMVLGIAARADGPLGRIRMAMDHLEQHLSKALPSPG